MSVHTAVREGTKDYTHRDQLFKELIHHFFREFLEVFFPEVHDFVDFQSIKPLSEEVFTDLHEGKTRRLDIVIETKLKQQDSVIIIHVEPQSSEQTNFHERMYHYFSLLYNKYRKPIIPIAIFTYEENWDKNEYNMTFPFLHVLTFHYFTLHLRKLNWRSYIESNNPVAAALLSKMGYREEEKIQVKKEFLQMMVRMDLNEAKHRLIYGFFERYLTLSKEEEELLMEEIKQLDDAEKILQIPISYEEKGIEKGIQKGIQKGIEKVAVELLRKGSSIKFVAEVTQLDEKRVEALKDSLA